MSTSTDRLLMIPQAVQIAKVSRSTIYYAVRHSELQLVKRGRSALIRETDLRTWMAGRPAPRAFAGQKQAFPVPSVRRREVRLKEAPERVGMSKSDLYAELAMAAANTAAMQSAS